MRGGQRKDCVEGQFVFSKNILVAGMPSYVKFFMNSLQLERIHCCSINEGWEALISHLKYNKVSFIVPFLILLINNFYNRQYACKSFETFSYFQN